MMEEKAILLVEDEVLIAMDEQMTLERQGYRVITASSGEKAIEAVQTNPGIDLILMDIDLGHGKDGTETAKIILSDHDLPVVFLSSHTEPEVVAKTETITSYGYVVKSSSITVLDASIKMAFKLFEANRVIKEKERELRTLLDNAPDVISRYDRSLRCLFINKAASKEFGLPVEQFIGKTNRELGMPADAVDSWERSLQATFQTKQIQSVYVDFTTGEEKRYYRSLIAPIITDSGEVSEVMSITRNRTKQRKTEKASECYKEIFDHSINGICMHRMIFDESGTPFDCEYLDINSAFEKHTGLNRMDLIGGTIRDIYPGNEAQAVIDLYADVLKTKVPLRQEIYFDPVDRWFELSIFPIENHEFTVVLQNITDRKKTEKALQESEERFRLMFHKHNAIMLLIDPESGRIIDANQSASNFYGYSAEQFSRMTIQQINTLPEGEVAHNRKLAAVEKKNSFHFYHRLSSGEVKKVQVHSSPIIRDERTELFSIIFDISNSKQA